MTTPKRMPEVGERIRIRWLGVSGRPGEPNYGDWAWATATGDFGHGWFDCDVALEGSGARLITCRFIGDYGANWRYPEDDPEVCGERPAIKDEDVPSE